MSECHIEGVTFTSMTPKVVALERSITLQKIKEVIFRKLHGTVEKRVITTIHFRYPTRLGKELSHYTVIDIIKDDYVEALLGIYDFIEL